VAEVERLRKAIRLAAQVAKAEGYHGWALTLANEVR
jgi:hypothetical protein